MNLNGLEPNPKVLISENYDNWVITLTGIFFFSYLFRNKAKNRQNTSADPATWKDSVTVIFCVFKCDSESNVNADRLSAARDQELFDVKAAASKKSKSKQTWNFPRFANYVHNSEKDMRQLRRLDWASERDETSCKVKSKYLNKSSVHYDRQSSR